MAGPHCRAAERAGANQWKMFYLICHSFQYFHINLLDREKSGVHAAWFIFIYAQTTAAASVLAAGQHCCCWRYVCSYGDGGSCDGDGQPRCQNDIQPSTITHRVTHCIVKLRICTFARTMFCFYIKDHVVTGKCSYTTWSNMTTKLH